MKKVILLLVAFIYTISNVISQTSQWRNYTNGNDINTIVEEGNYVWVGTEGGLVNIHTITGDQIHCNNANSGLPDNYISTIAIDQSGTKWIGTMYYGLAKFDDTTWTVYKSTNSGLRYNTITSIAIDINGTKWIGTQSGLAAFNENGIPFYIEEGIKKDNNVNIYPNPTNNYFNIELLTKINISLIEIFNIQGIIVNSHKISLNQNTVDIRGLSPGIYFLRIQTDRGVLLKKLIKQ